MFYLRMLTGETSIVSDKIDSCFVNLINLLRNKINEDSYFLSKMNYKDESPNRNCYVATQVYSDINHPKVEYLRGFRDATLSKYSLGKKFIFFYYKYSPELVLKFKRYKIINLIIKFFLDVLISTLTTYKLLKKAKFN